MRRDAALAHAERSDLGILEVQYESRPQMVAHSFRPRRFPRLALEICRVLRSRILPQDEGAVVVLALVSKILTTVLVRKMREPTEQRCTSLR
jgi:hypothetical protein